MRFLGSARILAWRSDDLRIMRVHSRLEIMWDRSIKTTAKLVCPPKYHVAAMKNEFTGT